MRILFHSRDHGIGDHIIHTTFAGCIKEHYPNYIVRFLVDEYLTSLITLCPFIDEVASFETMATNGCFDNVDVVFSTNREILQAAKKANVPLRISNLSKPSTWLSANSFELVSTKLLDSHNAKLNLKYLKKLNIYVNPTHDKLTKWSKLVSQNKLSLPVSLKNRQLIALNPGSHKSARNWPPENYLLLANKLKKKGFIPIMTGSRHEGDLYKQIFQEYTCFWGTLNLDQLASLYSQCTAVVACSTGPAHIAAAIGTHTFALFVNKKPLHPERWGPLGKSVSILSHQPQEPSKNKILGTHSSCTQNNRCKIRCTFDQCPCINAITVDQVVQEILKVT
jgi:heptosyltransferase-3